MSNLINNGGELLALFEHRLKWPDSVPLNPPKPTATWLADALYRVLQTNAQMHSGYLLASSMLLAGQIIGFVGLTRGEHELCLYPVDLNGMTGLLQTTEPWNKLSIVVRMDNAENFAIKPGDLVAVEVKTITAGKVADSTIFGNFGSIP